MNLERRVEGIEQAPGVRLRVIESTIAAGGVRDLSDGDLQSYIAQAAITPEGDWLMGLSDDDQALIAAGRWDDLSAEAKDSMPASLKGGQ